MSSIYTHLFLRKRQENKLFFLIALFVLMFFSLVFIFLPAKKISIKGKTSEIVFLTLTNLTSSQVSVIWKTNRPMRSFILYGEFANKLTFVAEDKLEEDGKESIYHYATLSGLNPSTIYFFAIKVKNKLVGRGVEPFRIKTPPQFLPSKKSPLVGRIIDRKGKPLKRKIVILQIEGAYPLSSITGEKGEFVIPLSLIFDKEGRKKIEISGKEKFELRVLGEDLVVKGSLMQFLEYPLPLRVGSQYFFSAAENKKIELKKKKVKREKYKVLLLYPKEGAVISNLRPLIKGRGIPYESVLVQIGGKKNIVLKTYVDEEGFWQADLPFKLSPDKYIIRVKTRDKNGEEVEIVRDFRITKGGESVLSVATPSATLEPTLPKTPTPTTFPSMTSTPMPTPTQTPKPSRLISPQPPVSGFDPKFVFGLSFLFLLPGVLLLLR